MAFPQSPSAPASRPAFLFSHRGALGDFVLAFPVLAVLRHHFHDHAFIGLGRPEHMALAKEMGFIDGFRDHESADLLPFYTGEGWPDLLSPVRAALMWMEESPALSALLHEHCEEGVCIHPPLPRGDMHLLDHHLLALETFRLPTRLDPDYHFPLLETKRPFALVHPGSGSAGKNYDPEFYAFIANELKGTRFKDTRILLGPAERGLRQQFEKRFTVEEPASVPELARLLAGASLFIGNDSGVSHLSALLGTRTLALYKSTSVRRWGVRGREALPLEAVNEEQAMSRIQKALQTV